MVFKTKLSTKFGFVNMFSIDLIYLSIFSPSLQTFITKLEACVNFPHAFLFSKLLKESLQEIMAMHLVQLRIFFSTVVCVC